jgi:hypothetical protein
MVLTVLKFLVMLSGNILIISDSLDVFRDKCTLVRFRLLSEACMKMTVFWYVSLCSLIENDLRFRVSCYHHHKGSPCRPEDSHLQPYFP